MVCSKILMTGGVALAILCGSTVAIGGKTPVVLPDSSLAGVADALAPSNDDTVGTAQASSTEISRQVLSNLREIRVQRSVPTVAGDSITVPEQSIQLINDALSATGGEIEPAVRALEQQLRTELRGVGIQVSLLGNTFADYNTAVAAMNDFILSLNSEQLAVALQSPTLMALHRLLSGKSNSVVPATGEVNPEGIIKISSL
jgi:hypothetical protein